MTTQSPSLEERFALHKEASKHIKDTIQGLGLKLVTVKSDAAANGMTAVYAPDGYTPGDIVPKMLAKGVVIAAGLHSAIKTKVRSDSLQIRYEPRVDTSRIFSTSGSDQWASASSTRNAETSRRSSLPSRRHLPRLATPRVLKRTDAII